jgi:TRAP-type mannitol/chloroaromatic compound transport system permease small subunit
MAQFIMTGYYLMGGAYSMKEHQHVRMDLVYGNFSEKNIRLEWIFLQASSLFFI